MSSCGGSLRMLMLRLAHLWILSFLFLQLCNAIPCNVTQDAGGTLYSVPEFQATGCEFYWTNITARGFVLANHESKMNGLVANITSLHTHGCLRQVHYKRDCISEGTPYEANCSANCSGNAEPQSIGGAPLTTRVPMSPETTPGHLTAVVPHAHWIVPVVVIAMFLLAVVVMVILGYKRRRHICGANRNSSIQQFIQNDRTSMADPGAQP